MAGDSIAAVDLVGAMKRAEDLFVSMKEEAKKAKKTLSERIDLSPNAWEMINEESTTLMMLLADCCKIVETMEESENLYNYYSCQIRNLKGIDDASSDLAGKSRNLQKNKKNKRRKLVKLSELEKDDEELKSGSGSGSGSSVEERIRAAKVKLAAMRKMLKFLRGARRLNLKAIDMVRRMLVLRVGNLKADFVVEIGECTDCSSIHVMKMMKDRFRDMYGGLNLKFRVGELFGEDDSLESISAEIECMSKGAIDEVKFGELYEFSIDGDGLCSFRRLTPAEATAIRV